LGQFTKSISIFTKDRKEKIKFNKNETIIQDKNLIAHGYQQKI